MTLRMTLRMSLRMRTDHDRYVQIRDIFLFFHCINQSETICTLQSIVYIMRTVGLCVPNTVNIIYIYNLPERSTLLATAPLVFDMTQSISFNCLSMWHRTKVITVGAAVRSVTTEKLLLCSTANSWI